MPVDFTDYTDPGVYIDIIDAPVTNLNGVAPTIVAIIGESSGDGRRISETTVLRSQYTTRLNSEGLDATTTKIKNRFSGVEYASAVFGTLSSDVAENDDSIDVTLSSLVPFSSTPFVIRVQDEYMRVANSVTATFQDTGDTVTYANHGLSNGNRVYFSSITSTTGITKDTLYYVVNKAANTFQLSLTNGGAAIALTTNGSGTLVFPTLSVSTVDGVATLPVIRGVDETGFSSGTGSVPAEYSAGIPANIWSAFDLTDSAKYELVATLNDSALTNEAPLDATIKTFFIVKSANIVAGDVLLFDNERMRVVSISNGTNSSSITVERGVQGTRASAHGKINDIWRVNGFDYYVKLDPGSNADFDGVDDQVIIGCIPGGRLAPEEGGEVVPNAESVEIIGFATDANQYAAELLTDLDDVKDKYGLPTVYSRGTTSVNSPLTLAAQIAFANGARQVYCIDIDTTSAEGDRVQAFKNAIDKASDIDNVNVIVPLTTSLSMPESDSVFDYLLDRISLQATLGVLSRGFVAYDGLTDQPETSDFSALAQRYSNARLSVVAPGRFKVATPTGNITVGGPFAAVAVAGLQASLSPQEPLTRKTLESSLLFNVEDKINVQKMTDMQSKGVLVLFNDRNGLVTIRHGLTTDMSDAYMREISVVTARDRLRDVIYDTLQTAALLGSPITSTTPERVVANVTGALESAKRSNLIFDYSDIKYRIPTNNPTAIEIRFAYRPTMPLNYVLVQFSIDTLNASVFFETVNQGGVV